MAATAQSLDTLRGMELRQSVTQSDRQHVTLISTVSLPIHGHQAVQICLSHRTTELYLAITPNNRVQPAPQHAKQRSALTTLCIKELQLHYVLNIRVIITPNGVSIAQVTELFSNHTADKGVVFT